eukprot:s141_g27.t1
MNIDTDTQWAFWDGMNEYQKKNKDYLQAQIGNPEGPEKPNKKFKTRHGSTMLFSNREVSAAIVEALQHFWPDTGHGWAWRKSPRDESTEAVGK